MVTEHRELAASELRKPCNSLKFEFATTAEVDAAREPVGQERALEALRFGIGISRDGYNLFAMGPTGIGKMTTVRDILRRASSQGATPSDWCYVNNFEAPHRPRVLRLPAGKGCELRRDMARLVEDLEMQIPAAFESEDFQNRVQEIEDEIKERQEQAVEELGNEATRDEIKLLRTPTGFAFAPVVDGEVISPDDFAKLPADKQEDIKSKIRSLQEKMQELMRSSLQWGKEGRERVRGMAREVALVAVEYVIAELKKRYAEHPEVVDYLSAVKADVLEHVDDFRRSKEPESGAQGFMFVADSSWRRKYEINVMVEHDPAGGQPVVYEDHPTYANLVGRVEQRAQLGALTTDHTLIKPGALHRANGGYLILDARNVLLQPLAWEGLKGALNTHEIRIESLAQFLAIATVTLEPEHVPLDVKVVLLGDRFIYYMLHQLDPEFGELFKVSVDFADRLDRDADNEMLYARVIATLVRENQLRHLDRDAVALVVEERSRDADDGEKISAHLGGLADLLREADYWAGESGHDVIERGDVERAVEMRLRRVDRIRSLVQEQIRRGTVLIDTSGAVPAQVNGLSVLSLGDFAFGQPSRITATARVGRGEVVDIEREAKLGGPTHSKGVLILSNFLAERFASERPLSLAASLVFEQSYGHVDGDSASVAETCALLSALADAPIKQSLAVTGSINQRGIVQAIGGVNEKIEGFFDVCAARGLTGEQGVVIPAANVKHLMLRRDVVAAADAGKFHVWPVRTIDEAVELLTGIEAGEPGPDGAYAADTINGRVATRLAELFDVRRKLASEQKADGGDRSTEAP